MEKKIKNDIHELTAMQNMLINMIMKSKDLITLKKKGTEETITEDYLRTLDMDKLIDTTEIIIEKIKRLDL